MDAVLETSGLSRSFGGIAAVQDVSLAVEAGTFVGVVGANGAGKTTFVNLVTGYLRPDGGTIRYLGADITGLTPRQVTRLGVARSFQMPQVFTRLTVLEDLLLAIAARTMRRGGFWLPLFQPGRLEEARVVLRQFGLEGYADRHVAELGEGPRKLLDVALAYALRPKLLFLDEPTSGVSNRDKLGVMDAIAGVLRQAGVTTIFIEHDMDVVERYSERVLAFVGGRVVADGRPADVLADPTVRTLILGA